MGPRKASDFVNQWISEHITADTHEGDLPELAAQCENDARSAGISPIKLVDETGTDIKTMIEQVHAELTRP